MVAVGYCHLLLPQGVTGLEALTPVEMTAFCLNLYNAMVRCAYRAPPCAAVVARMCGCKLSCTLPVLCRPRSCTPSWREVPQTSRCVAVWVWQHAWTTFSHPRLGLALHEHTECSRVRRSSPPMCAARGSPFFRACRCQGRWVRFSGTTPTSWAGIDCPWMKWSMVSCGVTRCCSSPHIAPLPPGLLSRCEAPVRSFVTERMVT
jgi:hypothetical protein